MDERICYHSRLPCPTDGKCASCDLHKSILTDTTSKKELLKESNAIHFPFARPYVKFRDKKGKKELEIGIKGTF